MAIDIELTKIENLPIDLPNYWDQYFYNALGASSYSPEGYPQVVVSGSNVSFQDQVFVTVGIDLFIIGGSITIDGNLNVYATGEISPPAPGFTLQVGVVNDSGVPASTFLPGAAISVNVGMVGAIVNADGQTATVWGTPGTSASYTTELANQDNSTPAEIIGQAQQWANPQHEVYAY